MPVYEYHCKACDHEFEREQRITDAPVRTCPSCGARQVRRLISRTSFVLKGGGWYSDLYASPSGKAGAAEKESGAEGKASPESSSDKPADKPASADKPADKPKEKPKDKAGKGGGTKSGGSKPESAGSSPSGGKSKASKAA